MPILLETGKSDTIPPADSTFTFPLTAARAAGLVHRNSGTASTPREQELPSEIPQERPPQSPHLLFRKNTMLARSRSMLESFFHLGLEKPAPLLCPLELGPEVLATEAGAESQAIGEDQEGTNKAPPRLQCVGCAMPLDGQPLTLVLDEEFLLLSGTSTCARAPLWQLQVSRLDAEDTLRVETRNGTQDLVLVAEHRLTDAVFLQTQGRPSPSSAPTPKTPLAWPRDAHTGMMSQSLLVRFEDAEHCKRAYEHLEAGFQTGSGRLVSGLQHFVKESCEDAGRRLALGRRAAGLPEDTPLVASTLGAVRSAKSLVLRTATTYWTPRVIMQVIAACFVIRVVLYILRLAF